MLLTDVAVQLTNAEYSDGRSGLNVDDESASERGAVNECC